MGYLVDTNLLLRSSDIDHPLYEIATNAVNLLLSRDERVCIVPQNLIEFWNVYTRPLANNGLGHTVAEAIEEVRRLKDFFELLPDTADIYLRWESLVTKYEVKGVRVHDAKLVAAMMVHGMSHILTFNVDDFSRYEEIITINPADV
jgi:predicted nucleic acid-binding protein